ncbi:MAG: hypothetical protein LBS52_07400 [Dysgonamonadaceae bacterium]|jgi:hypothetical protein|nr:hypothetical protein [Dysgonamonadaceae bacterium]
MMKNKILCAFFLLSLLFMASCSDKEAVFTPIISGIENSINMLEGSKLELSPAVENAGDARFSWTVDGKEVSTAMKYTFEPSAFGTYALVFTATNSAGSARFSISITVLPKANSYEVSAYTVLTFEPSAVFENNAVVEWTVTKSASPLHRLATDEKGNALFVAAKEGLYGVSGNDGKSTVEISIVVTKNESATPYIAKVFDYLPAPGQFVNKLPKYSEGDTHEDMLRKVADYLVGEDASMITLGGWGGYVTFGFDHTIVNVEGQRDFRVLGNAFASASNPQPGAPLGGSCEPGIVMVAYDKNKNGKPDEDEWYEINGSGNFSAENEPWYQIAVDNNNDVRTFRDYEMTYFRPITETPDENPDGFTSISKYIRWTDNKGQEGYKIKNIYHKQSYYPAWVAADAITYSGIRLADNGIDESGTGAYYVLYAFRYGYTDNFPNNDENSAIDIDWAIDQDGNKVVLPGIDFVKIYNGINKENGWLGETSTEVGGSTDLSTGEGSTEVGKAQDLHIY